jgi:hypothetical protein
VANLQSKEKHLSLRNERSRSLDFYRPKIYKSNIKADQNDSTKCITKNETKKYEELENIEKQQTIDDMNS